MAETWYNILNLITRVEIHILAIIGFEGFHQHLLRLSLSGGSIVTQFSSQ